MLSCLAQQEYADESFRHRQELSSAVGAAWTVQNVKGVGSLV